MTNNDADEILDPRCTVSLDDVGAPHDFAETAVRPGGRTHLFLARRDTT